MKTSGGSQRKGKRKMLLPTVIMAVLAVLLLGIGLRRGGGLHLEGLRAALGMIVEILPLLVFALIVAGMVQVLLPQALVSKWVGAEAGLRGILIGSIAGGLTPGGPYVSMPLVAGLWKSGAGIGTLVAYMTGWSLLAIVRLPLEVGFLGWRFVLIRLTCTFFMAPLAGLIAHFLFEGR